MIGGHGTEAKTKVVKQPRNPYICFYQEQARILRENDSTAVVNKEVRQVIYKKWRELSEVKKKKYIAIAKLSSKKYKEEKGKVDCLRTPKKTMTSRTALKVTCELFKKLTPGQVAVVRDMGFEGLLHLKITKLPRQLCEWLLQHFDPIARCLFVHGKQLLITPLDVNDILGLPCVGDEIDLQGEHSEIEKMCSKYGVRPDGSIPLANLRNDLGKLKTHGEEFQVRFGLYILGALLCPTSNLGINKRYLHAFKNLPSVGKYNWSSLVLTFLCEGVKTYKEKERCGARGCLLFLMLFYLDHVTPAAHYANSNGSKSLPRLLHWGDEEIRQRLELLKELKYEENEEVPMFMEDGIAKGVKTNEKDRNLLNFEVRLSQVENEVKELKNVVLCDVKNAIMGLSSIICDLKDELLREIKLMGNRREQSSKDEKEFTRVDPIFFEKEDLPMPSPKEDMVIPSVQILEDKTLFQESKKKEKATPGKVKEKLFDEDSFDKELNKFESHKEDVHEPKQNVLIPSVEILKDLNSFQQSKKEKKAKRAKVMKQLSDQMTSPLTPLTDLDKAPKEKLRRSPRKQQALFQVESHSSTAFPIFMSTRTVSQLKPSQYKCSPYVDLPKRKQPEMPALGNNGDKQIGMFPEQQKSKVAKLLKVIPPKLTEDEKMIERYIFHSKLMTDRKRENEILLHYGIDYAFRKNFQSLRPEKWLDDTVINMVVAKMTLSQHEKYPYGLYPNWYLPTYYAQSVLGAKPDVCSLATNYFGIERYGGDVQALQRVYIPINDSGDHWFLAVIDMKQRIVHYLDSMISAMDKIRRESFVKCVADFTDKVLIYLDKKAHQNSIKEFPVQLAQWTPQQPNGWDCGMYVIKYFEFTRLNSTERFKVAANSEEERRRLALDLVLDFHNTKRATILERARNYIT